MTSSEAFLQLVTAAQARLDEVVEAPEVDRDADRDATPDATPDAGAFGAALAVLGEAAGRMADNYPYASPLYAGQMLKPPHVVARAAYAMAMAVNPNNHALDGGRASSAMEIEAVAEMARMFGLAHPLGHLTSGGTFANLEALWIAGQLAPGKVVLASEQAHYTHSRITGVLQLGFRAVAVDERNRMSLGALEAELRRGDVGTVVVTLGTTATGAVDPLDGIVKLRERYGFRIHVDAAYGGYFALARNLAEDALAAYAALARADSIVVDPHKHGLQPYGCGCVLFADPTVGRFYKHDSPYTYFTSGELHLGEITLECSRAGAAAVALWSTQRLLPLTAGGAFARGLEGCHVAAADLYRRLSGSNLFFVPSASPQLDIVVWACVGEGVVESSEAAQRLFDRAAGLGLHLALAKLPISLFPRGTWPGGELPGSSTVTCLRSVLMKWEHQLWVDRIFELVLEASS